MGILPWYQHGCWFTQGAWKCTGKDVVYKSATFSATCKKYELMNIIQILLQSKKQTKKTHTHTHTQVTKSFARTKGDFTKVTMSYEWIHEEETWLQRWFDMFCIVCLYCNGSSSMGLVIWGAQMWGAKMWVWGWRPGACSTPQIFA